MSFKYTFALLLLIVSLPLHASDELGVEPADIKIASTVTCIGIEWHIAGDANENARVSVAYREKAEDRWQQAMGLMRVENIVHTGEGLDDPVIAEAERGRQYWTFDPPVAYGNLLAGSIFYLDPGTTYEIRLRLEDPDGGQAERIVKARTRAIPVAYAKGRTLHVKLASMNGDGSEAKPFGTLAQVQEVVRPGDTVLLHAGTYKSINIKTDGTREMPITWRGINRESAIVTGDNAIACPKRNHIIIENMTIQTEGIGVRAEHANHITVRGCLIKADRIGVYIYAGENGFVCDNIVTGRVKWSDPKGPAMKTEGIAVTGTGHVICRNFVANTCDAINVVGGQMETNNIDIYHNDIWVCTDDAIEIDHVSRNLRVFENRMTNCFSSMSNQPLFGGPCYWIRNVSYNCTGGFKFHCNPSGIVAIHNTIISHSIAWKDMGARNVYLRNNLFAGGRLKTGQQWNSWHSLRGINLDWDHDAVLRTKNVRLIELYARARSAPVGKVNYKSMKELFEDTGLEEHGVEITWRDFASIDEQPNESEVVRPDAWSIMLSPNSLAIDAGEKLPNVSSSFEGAGPDIGAWESGRPIPQYGPLPEYQAVDFDRLPAANEKNSQE